MIKEIIPTTIVEEKLLGTTFSSEHKSEKYNRYLQHICPKSQVTCRRINRDVLLKRLWNLSSVVAL